MATTTTSAKFTITAQNKTQAAFAEVNSSLKNLEQSVGKIGNVVGLGGMLGIGAGIGLVTSAIGKLIQINDEAKASFAGLQQEMNNSGLSSKISSEALEKYDESLSLHSQFTIDDIEQLQTVLLSFSNLSVHSLEQATDAARNYAAITNEQLTEVGKTMGAVLSDPIKGLRTLSTEFGVHLTASQVAAVEGFVRVGDTASATAIEIDALDKHLKGLDEAREAAKSTDVLTEALHGFLNLFHSSDLSPLEEAKKQVEELKEAVTMDQSRGISSVADEANLAQAQAYVAALEKQQAAQESETGSAQVNAKAVIAQMQALDKLDDSLKEQVATFGQSKAAILQYKFGIDNAAVSFKSMTAAQQASTLAEQQQAVSLQKQLEADDEAKKNKDAAIQKVKQAADAAKQFQKSMQDEVASLKEETATFGMNAQQKMQWLTTMGKYKDATDATKQSLIQLSAVEDSEKEKAEQVRKAQEALTQAKEKDAAAAKEIIKDSETAQQRYNALAASMEHLVGTTQDGVVITQKMIDTWAKLQSATKKDTSDMSKFTEEAYKNMQDSTAKLFDSIGQKGTSLKQIMHYLFASIAKDAANMLSAQLWSGSGGSASGGGGSSGGLISMISSFFSSGGGSSGAAGDGEIMGGAFAEGGVAPANKVSLIGESGPELMISHNDSDIIPNNQLQNLGGGHTYNSNVNIDARGAGPDEVAKLLTMKQQIVKQMRGETEYRLNRGAWMKT